MAKLGGTQVILVPDTAAHLYRFAVPDMTIGEATLNVGTLGGVQPSSATFSVTVPVANTFAATPEAAIQHTTASLDTLQQLVGLLQLSYDAATDSLGDLMLERYADAIAATGESIRQLSPADRVVFGRAAGEW